MAREVETVTRRKQFLRRKHQMIQRRRLSKHWDKELQFIVESPDIDGLEDTKRIYGITAVGGKVKPEKDVKCT
jgi:hypothetical protein